MKPFPSFSVRYFRCIAQPPRPALIALVLAAFGTSSWATPASDLVESSGVQGGIIVHLGATDGAFTSALKINDRFMVQGLATDRALVSRARVAMEKAGGYGPVSIHETDGKTLPYIDNLINLLVVSDPANVSEKEMLRVLVPEGVLMQKVQGAWTKTIKPRPTTLDEWTHYYYDAHGNAISKDEEVAPPERLQWVGSPRWSRHHDRISSLSAQVTSGGRMFYIMDEGSRISILLPSEWVLTARDAFNGSVLWKRPIGKWQEHMWPLKSGPTQLARRLVAKDQDVFVTLAIDAEVSRLDAATGETRNVYPETKGAEEILLIDGVLYVLVNPSAWQLTDFAPVHNTGDQKRVETEFNWDEKPRDLLAIEPVSGKILWKLEGKKIAPLTLAADGKRVLYYNAENLVCLDAQTGNEKWSDAPVSKRKLFEFNYGPRVILHDQTVLYAGGDGSMKGLDADSGKTLWTAPHEKSGYRSPEDLMVANNLVWNAGTLSGKQKGEFTGRDIRTGEVKVIFPPDVDTYWFHHRCYIAKGTEKYIMPSRTGIEFVSLENKSWDINHWVRGACLYGVIPANGLTYAGPHNCACYPEAKLDGMNALAPGTGSPHPAIRPDTERLVKGPAYDEPVPTPPSDQRDWPTYRHDNARSGYTSQDLVPDLSPAWAADIPGRLSTLTVADGRV